tara:strand:+ start:12690 stop:14039 length:1350 start_codon:yes stop_codon:yes gene_type:complete
VNYYYQKFYEIKNNIINKLAFPSLYSKYHKEKNNYFSYSFKYTKHDLFITILFPFVLLRLIITYLLFFSYYILSKLSKKRIIILLTREAAIKDYKNLEDLRFSGLSQLLRKKNFNIIYFYHGYKLFLPHINVLFSRDILFFSRNILNTYYFIRRIFQKKKKYTKWEYDLKITIISSYLISLYTRYTDACFFWDFNYDHYSLFLGGYLSNNKLIGSMHNYHSIKLLPWVSDSFVKELNIKYYFNDYETCYRYYKNDLTENFLPPLSKYYFKGSKIDILLIEENQTNQDGTLRYLNENKEFIRCLYIKFREDFRHKSKLSYKLNSLGLTYIEIKDLNKINKNIIIIGSVSTLLLEYAAKGFLVLSFSEYPKNFINLPSRKFVNLDYLRDYPQNQICYENPISISKNTNLRSLFKRDNLLLKTSESVNNNQLFSIYKIKSLVNLIMLSFDET